MSKLGYSTMTLTDLTETIPITLLLETNQNNNIQVKTGNLYTPDFSQKNENNEYVEELVITPSLFLGTEEIDLAKHPEFVIPGERTSGFIYYVLNYQDSEYQYSYIANNTNSIFVDNVGALHIRENLLGNLTIEAFIEDFYNEKHDYKIDLIQATNPVNFLLLEDNQNSYTAIISSKDGRQHFEKEKEEAIILNARLYNGTEIIFSTDEEDGIDSSDFRCEWYQLTKGTESLPQEGGSFEIERDDVYSEEKILCKIIGVSTGLEYSATIDIWDMKEDYHCVIVADSLSFNETIKEINLTANVYDSAGNLIEDDSNFVFEWNYIIDSELSRPDNNDARKLSLNLEEEKISETFVVSCKVSINEKQTTRLITNEFETIRFIPEFTVRVNPENIFINTSTDGSYLGKTDENANYLFEFSLVDKKGDLLEYKELIDDFSSNQTSNEIPINFTNLEEGYWKFQGSIDARELQNNWGDFSSSLYLDFNYKHYDQIYSSGLTIVKNIVGKDGLDGSSAYNVVILSSSGSTLTYGDADTTLSVQVYLGGQLMSPDSYNYQWRKDGELIENAIEASYKVETSSFSKKAIYDCIVSREEKAIGSASYTLIDDTDSLPISLILDSNLESHIQLKEKDTYLPDFTQKEVEITPTLFIGNNSIPIPIKLGGTIKTNTIYYKINGTEYYPTENISEEKIYVDNTGVLHIKENLIQNTTILALIHEFREENHNIQKDLIQSTSPINILFLDETNTNIYALINSDREYFDDNNEEDINLTAALYKDGAEVSSGELSYEWSDLNTDETAKDQVLTISRDKIKGRNLYTCKITENSTGFSYVANKLIQDFTDEYECRIIYDKPLLLNSQNSEINLEASLWNKNSNKEVTENLEFSWTLLSESNLEKVDFSTDRECKITLGSSLIPQNSSFTIACQISSTSGRIFATNLVTFHYSPSYSVRLTPQNFYVPMDKNNNILTGQNFEFTFQLIGEGGEPLNFSDNGSDVAPTFGEAGGNGIDLEISQNSSDKWDFKGTVNISTSYTWDSPSNALTYEFTYTYMGQIFTEEINIIKNIDGRDGISPINIVILSDTGSILTYGDTGAFLSVSVLQGTQEVEKSSLDYEWYQDGEKIPDVNNDTYYADINEIFGESTYSCKVFKEESLLGEASYRLIDQTDNPPISLMLKSNFEQNVQIKTGLKIEPNFADHPLIIEPILNIDNRNRPVTGIVYKVNDHEYSYSKDADTSLTFVAEDGMFFFRENLYQNFTITAYIENYQISGNNYRDIPASNSINFLFLEEGMDNYNLIIEARNSKTFFTDMSPGDIYLNPILYRGSEVVTEGFSFEWNNLSETEIKKLTDGSEGIQISRDKISGRDLYICTATDDIAGLTYSSSQLIQDFTDEYECQLVNDKPTLLNGNNPQVKITAQTWDKSLGEIVTNIGDENNNIGIFYKWEILTEKGEESISETGAEYTVDIANEPFSSYKNFTIVCHSYAGERLLATNLINFQQVPEYRVNISPQNIFALTNAAGEIEEKTFNFIFQLLDKDGKVLSFNTENDRAPSNSGNFTFNQESGWSFTGTLTLENNFSWETVGSKTYEFTYKYFGQEFSEEINLIKNQKGADGKPGESGANGSAGRSAYTIDFTNEFHSFEGGEAIALAGKTASCEVQGFYGDTACTIKAIRTTTEETNLLEEEITQGGLKIKATRNADSKKITLTFTTGDGTEDFPFLSEPGSISLYITIQNPNEETDTKTFFKTFSYTINYSDSSYYLELSNNTIKYSKAEGYEVDQITARALYRTINGAPNSYDGKIIYSIDNKEWRKFSDSIILADSQNLQNIYFRLYSRHASAISSDLIEENWLENNSNYLLDMETVPILHSLDGYEFGGENLIRWSKELPIEKNKWVSSDDLLSIGRDGDFSTLDFNVVYSDEETEEEKPEWINFKTPKIKLSSEYVGKTFCFSCYIYSDDWTTIDSGTDKDPKYWSIGVIASQNYEGNTRDRYGSLIRINNGGPMEGYKPNYEEWETGNWIRIYKTFVLDEKFLYQTDSTEVDDNGEIIIPSLISCQYFNLNFYLGKSGVLRVKKPKLELGNVPSSWSASPYDINLENITGINLLDNIFQREMIFNLDTNYRYNFAEETIFQNETYYSLSYKTILNKTGESASLYLVLEDENDNPREVLKTISLPSEDFSFLINSQDNLSQLSFYSYDPIKQTPVKELTCFIRCLKLEKGKYSTSWSLTDEQIDEMLDLQLIDYSLLDENGNVINFASQADFEDYKGEIGVIKQRVEDAEGTITVLNTNYSGISTSVNTLKDGGDENYLGKISRGTIQLGYETDDSTPFLILSSKQEGESFSMQLTNSSLSFYQNEQLLAEMNGYNLNIPFLKSSKIKIGNIIIKETPSGVGILWEE